VGGALADLGWKTATQNQGALARGLNSAAGEIVCPGVVAAWWRRGGGVVAAWWRRGGGVVAAWG